MNPMVPCCYVSHYVKHVMVIWTYDCAREDKLRLERFLEARPANSSNFVGKISSSVHDGFEHNDPADPSMDHVVCVERDAGPLDEWVVTTSQQNQRDHVDCC